MRSDMAKVIVERPRIGSRMRSKPRKGLRRQLQKHGYDVLPRREGIKRPYGHDTKHFNEHLGPLIRFLESCVGRPWNAVFSEISAHINRNSVVQDHVRDHVLQIVATHVVLIDGVPCGTEGREYGQPLRGSRWHNHLYVCPLTGILKRIKLRWTRKRPPEPKLPPPVRVDDNHVCRLVEGHWCLVTLRRLPLEPCLSADRDVLLERPVSSLTPGEARQHYGVAGYAVGWRRLARRELSQYPIPADWRKS
jgi:hypothetical protein